MSLTTLVFPCLAYSELSEILSFLTLRELWLLGHVNKSAFVTFLRERAIRKSSKFILREQTARFLHKGSIHDKVLLVSYPRSGNSFLRQLLEKETAIITGTVEMPGL